MTKNDSRTSSNAKINKALPIGRALLCHAFFLLLKFNLKKHLKYYAKFSAPK
jgi:hypothetical protein